MNKYVCEGAIVQRKNAFTYEGTVVALDRERNTLIARTKGKYWTDSIKNVEVISYKGVR